MIVDHLRRFIDFDLGWPGTLTDVALWTRSYIWENRDEFFGPGEYVLADKGEQLHTALMSVYINMR